MKCSHCGFENKDNAKFCTKCGNSLVQVTPNPVKQESSSSKYIIIALVVIIIILVGTIGFFALNMNSDATSTNDAAQSDSSQVNQSDDSNSSGGSSQADKSNDSDSSGGSSHADKSDDSDSSTKTTETKSASKTKSKSWELIGTYSGSGSGTQTITVPSGKIMVKLSAYPIKNYATNNLYVTGSNGVSGGVDWGPTSDVETRSDSFKYTSSSSQTFTIDYYETVSWEVDFYRYQ